MIVQRQKYRRLNSVIASDHHHVITLHWIAASLSIQTYGGVSPEWFNFRRFKQFLLLLLLYSSSSSSSSSSFFFTIIIITSLLLLLYFNFILLLYSLFLFFFFLLFVNESIPTNNNNSFGSIKRVNLHETLKQTNT